MPRLRFSPPSVAATPALGWVLLRAFGPVGVAAPPFATGSGAEEALALARRLHLGARIAARQPAAGLQLEVGGVAEELRRERATVVAADLVWEALAREVAGHAAALALPLVFLKAMGLKLGGYVAAGSRGASDLDVLVPESGCRPFHAALCAAGFEASPQPEMEHQLPPLRSPGGAMVEVHRMVLGVRPRRGRSARLADLADAGLLAPVGGFPGHAWVPGRTALAAHAAVHGLVQHGWAPHSYPALRTLGDLLDLGLGGEAGEALAAAMAPLLAQELAADDLAALVTLARELARGDLAGLHGGPASDPSAALLHHWLAGALHPDYGPSLRFAMLARPLSDRPPWRRRWLALWRALLPSSAELDAIYGPARNPLHQGLRRVSRPFDLVRRGARYQLSRRRLRREQRAPR